MQTVFVFGNPLVEEDSIALLTAEKLRGMKGFEFHEIESLGELEEIPNELIILDCAEGAEKIEVLSDLKKIAHEKKFSLHDFDLGTELLLLEKIGKLKGKKICIIALPQKMPLEEAVRGVSSLLSKNALNRKCMDRKP
ncbi:MAG: hypothetical protein J4415_02015 [Candidatus Diapherotrites archaeon]|uniref:Hydrogenase maturation protease n=1 Tax=Candidatus Iainarchaeum sp. TaxID=3101447 RepID=A0A8T4KX03_9ARCH|nr:hypothetical protein [Candidatus Diapherotrites archaeon]